MALASGEIQIYKKHKKAFWEAIFVVAVFALTLWSVFGGEDLGQVISYISQFNKAYFIPCIICILIFVLGESVIIHYLLNTLRITNKFFHCCLYSFVGFFFCAITPSASGGQPMQIIFMKRDGISVGVATVVLAIITVVYKMVLVILGAIVLAFRPAAIMLYLNDVLWIVWLGMILNVVFIALLLLLIFNPRYVNSFVSWCLRLINKIHPLKNLHKAQGAVDRFCTQYAGTSEYFLSHKRVILNVFLLTFIQRWALFVVTWFTYCAFNLSGEGFLVITSLQGMVSVAVDMLPLPGGMGISENLFLIIFKPIFGAEKVLAGMVVSRGISYYIQVVICGIMSGVAAIVIRSPKKTGEQTS